MFRPLVKKLFGLQRGVADPQLLMWFPCDQNIPEKSVPKGFAYRPFKGGDENAWCDLLNANGQLGVWDRVRMENEQLTILAEDGQCFVSNADGKLVACAGVYDRERVDGLCWEIGWIAVDPAHQGLGLGGSVAAEALRL
ncbi:MAG: GNAT family N-acetyltransferase, partial [Candidatus Latescibacterota bacterium]|nr:GNAT family N-acetyltransferase [Candidatus Latescibacterota bacterium]